MRLRCLDRWVMRWALPQMYAGVAQQGAVDATYQTIADIEVMLLKKEALWRNSRHL